MKRQYLKQFKKELSVPRKRKKEILRDLHEAFLSAAEHGETEQAVIERLGPPKELAEDIAGQLEAYPAAHRKRKRAVCSGFLFVSSAICFLLYGAASFSYPQFPSEAIGFAEGSTQIALANVFSIAPVFLRSGCIFVVGALVSMWRSIRQAERKS